MRAGLVLSALAFLACSTPGERRRAELAAFARVVERVPPGTRDWSEVRFQGAELHRDEAEAQFKAGADDDARGHLVIAASLLDEVLERDPAYDRTGEVVISRAAVAVQLERHTEAVRLLQRAVELGPAPANEAFVRRSLPRELRLSGDCARALEQPIPAGVVGDLVRLERAQCFAAETPKACDELMAVLGSTTKARREALKVGRTVLAKALQNDRDACLARIADPATVEALSKD